MTIYYLYNSGFACIHNDTLIVFDYYRDRCEGERSLENGVITPEFLTRFKRVFVLASHSHPDHFNAVVYNWAERPQGDAPVTYILSCEIPTHEGVFSHSLAPGQKVVYGDFSVKAFGSTDIGVSFDVKIGDYHLYHAGDFNFWHWDGHPDVDQAYVDNARTNFESILNTLECENCDAAFFPLDERLGARFTAGADMFIDRIKPKLFIPMHFCNKYQKLADYAGNAKVPVWAIGRRGDCVEV